MPSYAVGIDFGGTKLLTAVEARKGGCVVVYKVDENGTGVPGSCFAVNDGRTLLGQGCEDVFDFHAGSP